MPFYLLEEGFYYHSRSRDATELAGTCTPRPQTPQSAAERKEAPAVAIYPPTPAAFEDAGPIIYSNFNGCQEPPPEAGRTDTLSALVVTLILAIAGLFGCGTTEQPTSVEVENLAIDAQSSAKIAGVPYGTYLGEFNGVAAYSNGTVSNTGKRGVFGLMYQCVEFVNRYYVKVFGHKNMTGSGNAQNYYPTAASRGLRAYPNGGTEPPQSGDILCFAGGGYGHVAIVRSVEPWAFQVTPGPSKKFLVRVIHQNYTNTSADADYIFWAEYSNGKFTVRPVGSYTCQGWLRK